MSYIDPLGNEYGSVSCRAVNIPCGKDAMIQVVPMRRVSSSGFNQSAFAPASVEAIQTALASLVPVELPADEVEK